MVAVNAILIRYQWQLANLRALCESIDGPAGRPADNPSNSDRLGVYHGTVPEWAVQVYWRPGPPIWRRFGLDPDPNPKWRSGTVANTTNIKLNSELQMDAVIDRVCRWTWTPRSCWTLRCTWKLWSSQFGDALGGRDCVTQKMHLEAVIERVWRCTWRPWSSKIGGVLGDGWSGGTRLGGRCNGSWDSIQWLTCNRGNVEGWE